MTDISGGNYPRMFNLGDCKVSLLGSRQGGILIWVSGYGALDLPIVRRGCRQGIPWRIYHWK